MAECSTHCTREVSYQRLQRQPVVASRGTEKAASALSPLTRLTNGDRRKQEHHAPNFEKVLTPQVCIF